MVSLVEDDPDNYNLEDLQIPPSVMANEKLLKKFAALTEKHAAEVRENHLAQDHIKEETSAHQPKSSNPDIVSL